jgi:hypothetical protein
MKHSNLLTPLLYEDYIKLPHDSKLPFPNRFDQVTSTDPGNGNRSTVKFT